MPPELHLRPDRLRAHAATAAGLADQLRAFGAGPSTAEPAADRLRAAVRRATRELEDLSAALATAASSAVEADETTARSLRRLR